MKRTPDKALGAHIEPLTGGKRLQTIAGNVIAFDKFEMFWKEHIKLDKNEENLYQIEVFQKFGSYLKKMKKNLERTIRLIVVFNTFLERRRRSENCIHQILSGLFTTVI